MEKFIFEGKEYSPSLSTFIGEGEYGKVYRFNRDNCIKIFKKRDFYLNKVGIFSEIKGLQLPNFYTIKDFIYDEKGFAAYIMQFYEKKNINFLTLDTEFLVNVLINLLNDIERLSKHNILTNDMHYQNVILGDDKFTIIDTDNFSYSNLSYTNLLEINIAQLTLLIKTLILNCLNNYNQDNFRFELFRQDVLTNFSLNNFINYIKYYDRPIDSILKR